MSSNIIGPLHLSKKERLAEWFTMRQLRADVKFYQQTDPQKYQAAIEWEKTKYGEFLSRYVSKAA